MSAPEIKLTGVPELETERLRMRAPIAKDWPAYRDLMTSERAKYLGGPHTPGRAYKEFSVEIAHWVIHGAGPWMLCLKGTDDAIGLVGPYHPEGWPEREIGWMIFEGGEGHGYAFEAAVASRHWAYTEGGWESAVSYIGQGNTRSIALAERLGAVLDEAATPLDPGDLVYRHPSAADLGLRGVV
ncbi:MAG: GNAT family N-acetyltransferase [Pseudomonadota bacterium]